MALSKDVVIRLLGESASAEKAIKAAADAAEVSVSAYRKAERAQAQQAQAAEVAAQKQRAAMESVGKGAMVMGAVIAAGLGLAAKAAMDWESAWAGVVKVTDGTPAEMAALEGELRKLATTLPATHEEIAGVAEAAGQLGVARQDVAEFTKVAIAMGVSTNLSADDAATGMARLSNIMGTSNKDVDRMGSTIVALGNAGASTEQEILDMGLRIGAAGRQAGMSEGDVLGLANAMSSLGLEAEAGGTAMSLILKSINSAVLDGGDQLKAYAQIAGMSSEAFAQAWREKPAQALTTVIDGLGRLQKSGANVNTVIDDLGLGGIRTSDTLLRLAGNAKGLSESLAVGNKAWAENNALMNEANKRYETTASKLQIARNQISDAAIDIGDFLLPILASGADLVADFARGFGELPDPLKEVVTVLGLLAATTGLVGGAAIIAVPKIAAFRAVMTTLSTSAGGATSAVGKFGLFMTGPWGAALAIGTALLGGLITWLGKSSKASAEAEDYQHRLADALRESNGAIDSNIRAMAAQQAEDKKIGGSSLLQWASKLGISLPTVTDALLGQKDAYDQIVGAAQRRIDQIDKELAAGGANAVAKYTQLSTEKNQLQGVIGAYGDLGSSMGGAVAENERLAAATEKTGTAAGQTTGPMDNLATATSHVAGEAQDAATAAEKLAKLLDELNGPTLDMRDATRGYQDALHAISEGMKADGWAKTLDDSTEAGRKNNEMLDDLAKSAMEQANAIAANGGSYDAFRGSLDASRQALIAAAVSMGATDEQAQALADSILQIPDAADVDIKIPTYDQVTGQLSNVMAAIRGIPPQTWTNVGVLSEAAIAELERIGVKTRTLPDGTVEVEADTGQAKTDLDNFVNTRRTAHIGVVIETPTGYHMSGINGGPGGTQTRASGGPVWPGETFLVGENGPELVRFGQHGYVTPTDQTAQIMAALRQPAPVAPAFTMAAAGAVGGGSSTTSYSRTFAPVFQVASARPMSARQLMDLARDEEFLHG